MTPVDFEHKVSAGDRPQTYALDRAATGTDSMLLVEVNFRLLTSALGDGNLFTS